MANHSNFLERVIGLLEENGVRYCVIGGVGVSAYAEPIVTQDLDIVIAAEDLERARGLLEAGFRVKEVEHSLDVYDPGSKLQVQVQRGAELFPLVDRASLLDVLGMRLPIASPAGLLQAKAAAALEPARRPSKRGKDLLDIARLIGAFPGLRSRLPAELLPGWSRSWTILNRMGSPFLAAHLT